MQSEPSSGIKLTAYSCICWLFHRIYYDARNHKHKINLEIKFYFLAILISRSKFTFHTYLPFTVHKTACHKNHTTNTVSMSIACLLSSLYSPYTLFKNSRTNAVGNFVFKKVSDPMSPTPDLRSASNGLNVSVISHHRQN